MSNESTANGFPAAESHPNVNGSSTTASGFAAHLASANTGSFPESVAAAAHAPKRIVKGTVKKLARPSKNPAPKTETKKGLGRAKVLAYDLGGTKVAVGVVDSSGKILAAHREAVLIKKGKQATLKQLIDLGKKFIRQYPEIEAVGIASAGPLDPRTGELLDPTNFRGPEGPWGVTPIASILKKALKRDVVLENDAASAILAEAWKGQARDTKNAMIVTLGTGLGTAFLVDGELVRGANYAHTEGGHMVIRTGDDSAPCNCGNDGCAEGYLSGRSFTYRGRKIFGNDVIDAVQIAARARLGDPKALEHFDEYSDMLAAFLYNAYMLFSMEVVVFTGSFAAAQDLFLEETRRKLAHRMRRWVDTATPPRLEISGLDNQAGLLGGGFIALRKLGKA